jgi:hypothetical protein
MDAALALQAFRQFFQRQVGLPGQPFSQALARWLIDTRRRAARRRLRFNAAGGAHLAQQRLHEGLADMKQGGNFALRFAAIFERQQDFPAQIHRIRRCHEISQDQLHTLAQTTPHAIRFLLLSIKPL